MSNISLPSVEKQGRERRSAIIASQLKDMIMEGTLKPGDKLPTEEQLCNHFGVSRTTLRESVQMLRVSGLLEVTPGRGSFVRVPDLEKIMQDLAVYGAASRMSGDEVKELMYTLKRDMVTAACKAPSYQKHKLGAYAVCRQITPKENEEQERKWLLSIADVSGNRLSRAILAALMAMQNKGRMTRFTDPAEVQRVGEYQKRLNEAILDGNTEIAMRLLSAFLGRRQEALN